MVETRDTADPALVSQLLMTILEAYGCRVSPPLLYKRVRDDVVWEAGAETPWRRSAYWLVLRVGLARYLATTYGPEAGRARYKLLVCVVLAQLLRRSIGVVSVELLCNLRAKLARRLSKLETDRIKCPPSAVDIYNTVFPALGPFFHDTLQNATDHINATWNAFKRTIQRPAHTLPRRADRSSLRLRLPNSGKVLESILASPFPLDASHHQQVSFDINGGDQAPRSFFDRHSRLSAIEQEVADGIFEGRLNGLSDEKACLEISAAIERYLEDVGSAYDGLPEMQSAKVLTVMDMWMMMDERATTEIGLLLDYSPTILAAALDVLQLPSRPQMCRLQRIQGYLQTRAERAGAGAPTIFDNPSKRCFAVRYYDECGDSSKMAKLNQRIEKQAEGMRIKKTKEWEKRSKDYEDLSLQISQTQCLCGRARRREKNNDLGCKKCEMKQRRRKMGIVIHEHLLPEDQAQNKAVIFELQCPPVFAAYRTAVWSILSRLGYQHLAASTEATYGLRDYNKLAPFLTPPVGNISLSSKTKSHLKTHYKWARLPVELDKVLRPHGMTFSYQDTVTRIWCAQKPEPSFAHLCQWMIPSGSPLAQLQSLPNFAVDAGGPSSNEILASQPQCPNGLSVQEFTAVQSLFAGRHCRWPSILIELGSSHLNFSSEAITLIIAQLAVHAGPAEPGDPLRTIHRVFHDDEFCAQLASQIAQWLELIATNWREAHMMNMLITLLLRLASLATGAAKTRAMDLVEMAQGMTHEWMGRLRSEIHKAADSDASQKLSRNMLWAALLCRKTCAAYTDEATPSWKLQPRALQRFIEASIAMQENLDSDPAALPGSLKLTLIQDVRMRRWMSGFMRSSIEHNPRSLTAAVDSVWPNGAHGEPRQYSHPKFINKPPRQWIELQVDWQEGAWRQTIHFDVLDGRLLVDGKPLSRLPSEHQDSWMLNELFGRQNLLTYPSYMPGMLYMLNFAPGGHEIHLGTRENRLIIRACYRGALLELVPRNTFGSPENPDLPASLVENCVHWLNLTTGVVEARQKPSIWIQKRSNWTIDIRRRLARRHRVFLVDPYSPLFDRVASMFCGFEDRARLTVYQPQSTNGGLSIELRRLDLNFFVNEAGRLYCRELRGEVDPDQDAGTWYGLDSKIVLRDDQNPHQRSILVPLGPLSWVRRGIHIALHAENSGNYGIFAINTVLGRLDCPAEARLLFFKALLHAYTSFIVPDPLTLRTGTEEALHCLRAGQNQPWTPLNPAFAQYLGLLAKLTPRRVYYPPDGKAMQQIFWDARLPAATQNDAFGPLVAAIYEKSLRLSAFSSVESMELSLEDTGSPHLRRRSSARRSAFWRVDSHESDALGCRDMLYHSRDHQAMGSRHADVFESVTLVHTWRAEFPVRPDLAGLLQRWPIIQMCGSHPDRLLLSNLFSADFAMEWGALVSLCRRARAADSHLLCFVLSAISFRQTLDMSLVRTLIAFAVSDDLKALEPPAWPSYSRFKPNQAPSVKYLLQLLDPFRNTYEAGSIVSEMMHREQVDVYCRQLAEFLLSQWPCPNPTLDGFSGDNPLLLDVSGAMDAVEADWMRLMQNQELSGWVTRVQGTLDRLCSTTNIQLPEAFVGDADFVLHKRRERDVPCLGDELLGKQHVFRAQEDDRKARDHAYLAGPVHVSFSPGRSNLACEAPANQISSEQSQELRYIVSGMIASRSNVRRQYGRGLERSLQALETVQGSTNVQDGAAKPFNRVLTPSGVAHKAVLARFEQICQALECDDPRVAWLKHGGLWPCISPVTLLERLRTVAKTRFGVGMRDALVEYGMSITTLQQLLRIDDARMRKNAKVADEEAGNPGHENWDPAEYPDWLLLEIDGNLLIRRKQVDVALSTISPPSGGNAVLQMNMGQGKTSCIVPMVAAALADSKRLLRVIVPKALLVQTAQVLQARLGNLLGREVRSVPFSRRMPTTVESVEAFLGIHRDIMSSSGVIVTLPEHVLSFKLSGTQQLLDGKISEARHMIGAQKWMNRVCRDVLDECDFTLATQTQLIYPSGPQTTLDGHPSRWQTAETLLKLVQSYLWGLQEDFPRSIEVVSRHDGGFPWLFFLRADAEEALITRLADHITRGKTSILSLKDCSSADREVVRRFISETHVQETDEQCIEIIFAGRELIRKNTYLLRGLLAHGILLLTLKKRWNVQYGLDPTREPISVPYHAKGVPFDQAEWGHPDVAILFTCLSFYFAGLRLTQFQQCAQLILQSDDPTTEYDRWTGSSPTLPGQLREWTLINVDDEVQIRELWNHLRHNVIVIDYFMNHFVFPIYAKQFHTQICASGWDIPLCRPETPESAVQPEETHVPMTTGFSGTNDNRTLLPLTIKQRDLPGLMHTNADVLTYLLQPRNRGYVLAADHGRRVSEEALLYKIREHGIRILIDAGAQILEMDNLALVKTWMRVDSTAKAALYFNTENRPFILYRSGTQVPLLASSLANDLSECLVYLDEAHTRGTDLKLPPNAKGALTLGLGQTKDQTVQGLTLSRWWIL